MHVNGKQRKRRGEGGAEEVQILGIDCSEQWGVWENGEEECVGYRGARLYSLGMATLNKRQEAELKVVELKMLRWE